MTKINRVIISQPAPSGANTSPYTDIINKYGVTIDFVPFFKVEPVTSRDFWSQKITILDHTAIVFSSKSTIDAFFKICEATRVNIPDTMKYFCTTESIANYLQKYIIYRKRKIFPCQGTAASIIETIGTKHKSEKFLLAMTDAPKAEMVKLFSKAKLQFTSAIFCRTVYSDLSSLNLMGYDVAVFYSPFDIKSLFEQYPDFSQESLQISTFGPSTAKAAIAAGLNVLIEAPTPQYPSVSQVLTSLLEKNNG